MLSALLFICFVFGVYKNKCEDTKGVHRSHKSKDRHHNGQPKKGKRANSDQQNISRKTKDQATLTTIKIGGELGYPER